MAPQFVLLVLNIRHHNGAICGSSIKLNIDRAYICSLQLGCHPVAAVQYTFTHKQYTEQYSTVEYTELT